MPRTDMIRPLGRGVPAIPHFSLVTFLPLVLAMQPAHAAGSIDNTAVVTGTRDGIVHSSTPASNSVPLADPVYALGVEVGAVLDAGFSGSDDLEAGDVLNLSITVVNNSTATVTELAPAIETLLFNATSGSGTVPVFTPATSGPVAPGGQQIFTASYTLTQADIARAAGVPDGVAAAVSVGGKGAGSAPISGSGSASATIEANPRLVLAKSSSITLDANANGLADAGDQITYVYVVQNTGNVALTDVKILDDHEGTVLDSSSVTSNTSGPFDETEVDADVLGQNADAAGDGVFDLLGVAGSVRFTYVHTVTQDEFDRQ